jgi:glutathione synthase
LRFLILTDHAGHSDQNSLYALTRTLAADNRTTSVFVASRSDERNRGFFAGDLGAVLYGIRAKETFAFDPSGRRFTASEETVFYGEADVVWLRLPPSTDGAFFAHLASFAPAAAPSPKAGGGPDGAGQEPGATLPKKPLVINNPRGIMETGSKEFLLHFPDFTAPVRRMQSAVDVQSFLAQHGAIVLKPLREYGGRGLVKISGGTTEEDGRTAPLADWLQTAEFSNYLAMKYLKNVGRGDKRILVVNGHILGASLRIPAPGQWLCNVARGGTSVVADVAPEEEAMIAAVAPVLLAKGIVIFGADTLVDDDGKRVLSELNTNSIGGFPQAEAQTGLPILQQTIDGIYNYLGARL